MKLVCALESGQGAANRALLAIKCFWSVSIDG